MQYDTHLIEWLKHRHISESIISQFGIHVGEQKDFGTCIVIPIEDTGYNKYRRDPLIDCKPKYISDVGLHATLFGYKYLTPLTTRVLITEGELDCLVAWSANIEAVTSTTGALSFQEEWKDALAGKDIYVCFDNDEAGAKGMVKTLDIFPDAKIVLVPELVGIKDISDFVERGGDIHALLASAKTYKDAQDVEDDRANRRAHFLSTRFHDAYKEAREKKPSTTCPRSAYFGNDMVERAKTVPISSLIRFAHNGAKCIFHNEKTASMHYYPATNSVYCFGCAKHGDSITVARQLYGLSFKEAVAYLNTL